MANYENVNEQTESFDGNYGQRFLSANRQAKIVSPINNVGQRFNYSKAISKYQKRENEDSISKTSNSSNDDIETGPDNQKSLVQKGQEKAVDVASKRFLPPGLRGIGKSIANNFLGNTNTAKPDPLILKAKKMKLYLIAGGVSLGLIFILAIVFSVLSTGGTEVSGAGFNDVSDYELENVGDTGEVATDTTTTDTTAQQTTDTTSSEKPAVE